MQFLLVFGNKVFLFFKYYSSNISRISCKNTIYLRKICNDLYMSFKYGLNESKNYLFFQRACFSDIESIAVNFLALYLFKSIKCDTNTALVRIFIQDTLRRLGILRKLYFRTYVFKNLIQDFITAVRQVLVQNILLLPLHCLL